MQEILIAPSKLSEKINNKINEIASILKNTTSDRPDLMGGKSGEALFWAYYSKYKSGEEYEDIMSTRVFEAFDSINEGFSFHTFAGGIAGIGWTIEHLVQNKFINADTNEVLGPLDVFLYKIMIQDIAQGNYDYLHNSLGLGLYFLKREETENTRKYLEELVIELEKVAVKTENTICWESKINQEDDKVGYNLSLSHGLASIIMCLSRFNEIGILPQKTKEMVEKAVNYLLNNKQDVEKYNYYFPAYILKKGQENGGRLAWCYNDLGISMVLWQAGCIFKNEQWKTEANQILLHTTKLKTKQETNVVDAGLCHGAAGAAHIYNRFYTYTKNEVFKNAAIYWFEQCLEMADFKDGLAGYKAFRLPEYGGWKNESGLLEGIAGIGLALISAVSEIEPDWDKTLLLS